MEKEVSQTRLLVVIGMGSLLLAQPGDPVLYLLVGEKFQAWSGRRAFTLPTYG